MSSGNGATPGSLPYFPGESLDAPSDQRGLALLNAEGLSQHPDASVVVLPTHGQAVAAQTLSGSSQLAVSWPGGQLETIRRTDWEPLAGRRVTIWPPPDIAGPAAAAIAERLIPLKCEVYAVNGGSSLADLLIAGGTRDTVREYVRTHRKPVGQREAQPLLVHDAQDTSDSQPPARGSHSQIWDYYELERASSGVPHPNLDNMQRIAARHPQLWRSLWWDDFRSRVMWHDGQSEREWLEERDGLALTVLLQRTVHLPKITPNLVNDGVRAYAHTRSRHPVRAWLESLPPWDGQARLALLLPLAFGTEDDDYFRAVGRNFLIGMVARVMQPGCQLDTMPVFEGAQGAGKTTALRILGGAWYSSNKAGMQEKDFLQGLQGFWLVEIEELESVNRATLERTKSIISSNRDDFRSSYGRHVRSYPRQCVFAGSTNSDSWNSDETGARRFWPVACGAIDLQWLREWREALFAEAIARYGAGEAWHEVPHARAAEEQELRRVADPWAVQISGPLAGLKSVTIEHLLRELELTAERRDLTAARRVGRILRSLDWRPKIARVNGVVAKIFYPPTGRAVESARREREPDVDT